jgi:RNA polymerase-binding transcription factor DksA
MARYSNVVAATSPCAVCGTEWPVTRHTFIRGTVRCFTCRTDPEEMRQAFARRLAFMQEWVPGFREVQDDV